MPAESPFSIANYFLQKAAKMGDNLSPMQLIKLVYIAHGWHLGLTDGTPLLNEPIQAWKYGPMVVSVYGICKEFGGRPVPSEALMPYSATLPDRTTDFLDAVWNAYSEYTGPQLSALTHLPGTPWHQVWNEHGGAERRGAIIPEGLITAHYRQKADAQQ